MPQNEEYIQQYIYISNEDEDIPNDANKAKKEAEEMFKTENFFDVITKSIDKTAGEVLLMAFKYVIRHNLSITAACDLMNLINCLFSEPILPDTRYMLNEICKKQCNTKFYAMCIECQAYLGEVENINSFVICHICNTKNELSGSGCPNYFVSIDPSDTIAELLTKHDEYYDHVVKNRRHEKGHLQDIFDGKKNRAFVKSLPVTDQSNYCTAIFNTDGAQKFKFSQFSIWPVYILLNKLPVESRLSNVITCGLWFGKQKPNINCFLGPFVQIMNELSALGINCTIKGETRNIKLYPLVASVDSVARAPMQGLIQFNGFFGCNWCEQHGLWCEGSVKYPITDSEPVERDHDSTVSKMFHALDSGQYTCKCQISVMSDSVKGRVR